MDLRERLSDRIHIEDIHEILRYVQGSQKRKSELYGLIFDPDETIGYQALWACSHFSTDENKWLYDKQDELINEILVCKHPGKRRLLLNLLLRQPQQFVPEERDFSSVPNLHRFPQLSERDSRSLYL